MFDNDGPPAGATRAEVELWNQRNITQALLCAQFIGRGGVPRAVAQRIEACTDPAKLAAARERMSQLSSPEELEL